MRDAPGYRDSPSDVIGRKEDVILRPATAELRLNRCSQAEGSILSPRNRASEGRRWIERQRIRGRRAAIPRVKNPGPERHEVRLRGLWPPVAARSADGGAGRPLSHLRTFA